MAQVPRLGIVTVFLSAESFAGDDFVPWEPGAMLSCALDISRSSRAEGDSSASSENVAVCPCQTWSFVELSGSANAPSSSGASRTVASVPALVMRWVPALAVRWVLAVAGPTDAGMVTVQGPRARAAASVTLNRARMRGCRRAAMCRTSLGTNFPDARVSAGIV